MGVESFTIVLDSESGSYSPGQQVSGRVIVGTTGGDEFASEIVIRFYGEVLTQWSKSSTSTKLNAGYELFFDLSKTLLGGQSNDKVQLSEGETSFPFSFPIDDRPLPPPCKFPDGHVAYLLQAYISQPWLNKDIKSNVIRVSIFTPLDLNQVPDAGSPMHTPEIKTFGCFCKCQREPVTFTSSTLKLGYCPGEEIAFTVKVDNSSENTIHKVSASLVQTWILIGYRSDANDQRFHTHSSRLQDFHHEDIGPKQNVEWDMTFSLPEGLHPTFTESEFVKLEYAVKVNARSAACCWRKVGFEHPVIVGSIPIR